MTGAGRAQCAFAALGLVRSACVPAADALTRRKRVAANPH
ncbi:hypothetical protein PD5205_03924 [Xanthomonas fragariae]|uniref:Uncharacterized protein n=1 Tax=Xanthomonas fragariae TaxID=48664 RepID=A0A1Y6H115_9XANT|nr:hypothetical protein NBC2815_03907 [Xanthomonas fragariae]SMR01159.1 hypothetical protein PD885_03945 [Xanthomonas fragariae]SMR05196.1 hypothetical protein PD5205_03924 [Xanthomonas fragariae]